LNDLLYGNFLRVAWSSIIFRNIVKNVIRNL